MKRLLILVLCSLVAWCCKTNPSYQGTHIEIQTQYGAIKVELYPKKAPKTVAAFLSYIDAGFYKNCSFYRVLNMDNQPSNAPKTELVQGGLWSANGKRMVTVPGIPHETTQRSGMLHKAGTISMARLEPGTAGTEFFICLEDAPGLDYGGANAADKQGYAAFGRVLKGMDVVRKAYRHNEEDQYFDPPIVILKITRL